METIIVKLEGAYYKAYNLDGSLFGKFLHQGNLFFGEEEKLTKDEFFNFMFSK